MYMRQGRLIFFKKAISKYIWFMTDKILTDLFLGELSQVPPCLKAEHILCQESAIRGICIIVNCR